MRFILIVFLFTLSCSKDPNKCLDLKFIDGITYFDKKPYTGNCNQFFKNGKIKSSQQFIDGLDHGNWKFYYLNGTLETDAYFIEGKRNGKWTYFFENGSVKQVNFYKNGIKDSLWSKFNKDGKKIWIKKFENGNIVESEEFNYIND